MDKKQKIIKVLIVDDSAVVRDFLFYIISNEPDMHVVGTAKNGIEALNMLEKKNPDIITMDIEMPGMNGYECTSEIMSFKPKPIIIVTSSFKKNDVEKSFKAIEAGALGIIEKPKGFKSPEHISSRNELLKYIRVMSEVKMITRNTKYISRQKPQPKTPLLPNEKETKYQIVAIGVSTGGPQVLSELLPLFPTTFNVPIVIVQHISQGFLEGMVDWLQKNTKLKIKIAEDKETLLPGFIYFCPAETNIGISKKQQVEFKKDIPFTTTPSVSYLFKTVRNSFGMQAIGVLLSGMGKDGVNELALMKESGAVTIVQDRESSVVYGMPGEAVLIDAQKYVLSPPKIAQKISELCK